MHAMTANLTFADLLRSPIGEKVSDRHLCRILDDHQRAGRFSVKGCPNGWQVMGRPMVRGTAHTHITFPLEEAFVYCFHPAHGGCLVREAELDKGETNAEVDALIALCQSTHLGQLKGIRWNGDQLWLIAYDRVLVITDLLFPGRLMGPLLWPEKPAYGFIDASKLWQPPPHPVLSELPPGVKPAYGFIDASKLWQPPPDPVLDELPPGVSAEEMAAFVLSLDGNQKQRASRLTEKYGIKTEAARAFVRKTAGKQKPGPK